MKRNRIEVNLEVKARYVCPLCSYETERVDEMVNHMVTVHNEIEEEVYEELIDEVYGQIQLVGVDLWI